MRCFDKVFINICQNVQTIHSVLSTPPSIFKFEAVRNIIANNVINSPADVIFDTGNFVSLTPGFESVKGSIFKAYIDGCLNK